MSLAPLVFLATPLETFTPTNSGALAIYNHEIALRARADGCDAQIVMRAAPPHIAPYADLPAHFVEFPAAREGSIAWKLGRLERKITGWQHVGQRVYMKRLEAVLRAQNLQRATLLISNDPDLVVYLRPKLPDARIVHIFHNQLPAKARVRAAYKASVDAHAAVSTFTRDWNADYYGLDKSEIAVVYNGVDSAQFHPAATEPSGPPILNFTGRTGREKAPDLLLRAALILRARGLEFGVQLVGSNHWGAQTMDDYQRELDDLVAQLQARDVTVTRFGHVDRVHIADHFRRAQIHVVPSRWDEPFGLTTVEGMASGLATIASRTGGSPEIIGEAGLLFARDDADDLAAKLESLLRDDTLRRDYAQRARARALEFSWDATWRGLRELL